MIIYIIFSFFLAFKAFPYFLEQNQLLCVFSKEKCDSRADLAWFYSKPTYEYLKETLNDNETFVGMEGILFFYIRQDQGLPNLQFEQAFEREVGRYPLMADKARYFQSNNRTVRYLLLTPYRERYKDEKEIFNTYEPNHVISLKGVDIVFIYDLQNLVKKDF